MLVDAHTHLDRYDLVGEGALESALEEITQHGILTISNSMDLASFERNLEIAGGCDLVLPTFGVHPWNATEYAGSLETTEAAIESSPILGEIGLDHYFVEDTSTYTDQRKVFEFFLAAAREQGKIVNLHTKGAEAEVLELLQRYDIPRAIVHWYSGPLGVFREMASRGVFFTVGVEVLHSERIRKIAREIPSAQLLTETDNPGGPEWLTGTPGMPALVEHVVQALAEVRESTPEEIRQTVWSNLMRLFRDDPWLGDRCAILGRTDG
jgi:TatD DNase family protein